MDPRYIQPYANPQRNSCQRVNLAASGVRDWTFVYNNDGLAGGARCIHVIDNKRAVIDFGGVFFALDMQRRSTISAPMKSDNTFIGLGEGQLLYLFSGWELVPLEFDRIISDQLGTEEVDSEDEDQQPEGEAEETESETEPSSRTRYYIPGLGQYSILVCFCPDTEGAIFGIQGTGTPRFPQRKFGLFRMTFGGETAIWSRGFDGMGIAPPISSERQSVLAHTDTLTLVDAGGGIIGEIAGEKVGPFTPVACSIGPDNLIYLVCITEAGPRLRQYDFWGELVREIEGVTAEPIQPPIVGVDSIVYLLDAGKVEAFKEGKKLWAYPLTAEAPAATVSGDGKLLIADGVRIVCLDGDGQEVWSYTDADGEVFTTPPVIDEAGHVLAASNNVVIMLK